MLRSVLVMLHHAIGPQWLRVFDDQIALDDQPDLLVDVTRFRRLLAGVATHRHASLAACNACVLALADAADIASSPFLAGFALPDAPEFDLWQSMQTDSLQRELAEVLEQLAVVHAGAGRNEMRTAIDYALPLACAGSAARAGASPADVALCREPAIVRPLSANSTSAAACWLPNSTPIHRPKRSICVTGSWPAMSV